MLGNVSRSIASCLSAGASRDRTWRVRRFEGQSRNPPTRTTVCPSAMVASICGRTGRLRRRPDGGVPLATRVHTRPKFEIGVVDLLAQKRELVSAPGTTSTRLLSGRTETAEFGVPSESRASRFRAVKKKTASLVHTEMKMSTHKHFEAGIELRSLGIIGYNRNINGMRPTFEESHFCPLDPTDADRLVHTFRTPTSGTEVTAGKSRETRTL